MVTPNANSALGGKGVKRKLKVQTIETKYEAIVAVEKGEKTKTAIAEQYGVPLNILSTWLKNKEKIMNAFQKFNPKRKNIKTATFSDVEEATVKWFKSARDRNVPVSGPFLATKAEEFAKKFDIANFKA